MLMPSIFGNDFMNDFFGFPEREFRHTFSQNGLMKTDVEEGDNDYTVVMDLPGYSKDNVSAELNDGYLTVTANTNTGNDEKDRNGRYVRRERYTGSCSRSFYVGEDITEEDIKASFKDGTLILNIPKKEAQPKVEQKKYIAIEG